MLKHMHFNVLNGDALASSFPGAHIDGELVIMRECLMDGDLSADHLSDFWQVRAKFLGVSEEEYNDRVVGEMDKLLHAPDNSSFNLWFEYDLFCQVNMWFLLHLIHRLPIRKTVSAVYSKHLDRSSEHFWNGFGPADGEQLQICYHNRVTLSDNDLYFGHQLWRAYQAGELQQLASLAEQKHSGFPHVKEVVTAHIDRIPTGERRGRPEIIVAEIVDKGVTDFSQVFREFWKRESIYGFGDVQLKKIFDAVISRS